MVFVAELVVVGVLTLIINVGLQSKFGVAALTAPFIFVVPLMQLGRNVRLQRASFIKDYVSQFFTNDKLYRTYHDLIYTYDDETYAKVNQIANEIDEKNKVKPMFDCFESLNRSRQEGARLYHPDFFQGSLEEQRLDALLGYFDVIGFYYCRGFLKMEDIAGTLGYYLAFIGRRQVLKRYFEICANPEYWSAESKLFATEPFGYLRRLLLDFEKYNREHGDALRKLQQDVMFR